MIYDLNSRKTALWNISGDRSDPHFIKNGYLVAEYFSHKWFTIGRVNQLNRGDFYLVNSLRQGEGNAHFFEPGDIDVDGVFSLFYLYRRFWSGYCSLFCVFYPISGRWGYALFSDWHPQSLRDLCANAQNCGYASSMRVDRQAWFGVAQAFFSVKSRSLEQNSFVV